MKKLLLLLAVVGLIFTACEPANGLDDDNNTEQPGSGDQGGEDNPDNPGSGEGGEDNPDNPGGGDQGGEEIPADKTQAIKFQDENTKLLCTLHWDENEDGELSYEEAAAVTDLGTAFKGSSILAFTELKYFTSLEKIADSAFEGCVSLVKITMPEQITTIGASAFNGCTNLKKIAIPNAVTEIGGNSFNGCSSLTSATIGNGVTSIGGQAFYGCSSLTSITIPDSVTSIGDSAFRGCTSLTSATIGNGVTSIGDSAFSGCPSLTSVTIGNRVTSIGSYAFSGCSSLTSVYCKPTTPPAGEWSMFYNNASGRKIYVPRNSVEAYKTASGWSRYASDIEGYDF